MDVLWKILTNDELGNKRMRKRKGHELGETAKYHLCTAEWSKGGPSRDRYEGSGVQNKLIQIVRADRYFFRSTTSQLSNTDIMKN